MTRPDEPTWSRGLSVLSAVLFAISVVRFSFEWVRLSGAGGGGFAILGEYIMLIITSALGVILAWVLAGVALAQEKSRFGVWLLILETPFLLLALVGLALMFVG